MTRSAAVVLGILLAGCVREPRFAPGEGAGAETAEERVARERAREGFETLRHAVLEGNAVGALRAMSLRMCSDWMFKRMSEKDDPVLPALLERLDSSTRLDLEAWFRRQKDVPLPLGNRRPDPLPESVYLSKWFVDVWTTYFRDPKDLELQRQHFRAMEVGEVYVDGPGASVLVKVAGTPAMMYSMVLENGEWKLDWVTTPPRASQ